MHKIEQSHTKMMEYGNLRSKLRHNKITTKNTSLTYYWQHFTVPIARSMVIKLTLNAFKYTYSL